MSFTKRQALEVYAAYSDSNELSDKPRNLDFQAMLAVNSFEATQIMTYALGLTSAMQEGYNNFSPHLLLNLPLDSKVFLSREGSVCVYVKSKTLESMFGEVDFSMETELVRSFYKTIKCDEFNSKKDEFNQDLTYRIWWD